MVMEMHGVKVDDKTAQIIDAKKGITIKVTDGPSCITVVLSADEATLLGVQITEAVVRFYQREASPTNIKEA